MSKRPVTLGMILVVVGLGMGAWVGVSGVSKPSVQAAKALPVLSVSVVAAAQKTLDDNIRVIGTVVPRENVVVISELAGLRVRAVYAETGDYVKQGQRIALLDGESLSIQSQSLQSHFGRTRDEYARFKELQLSGVISKESLQQRQAAFEVARSRLRDAQLNINRTQIVAPTDGLIYERTATIGGLTNGSEPLFRIAKDGKVEMEASVPEALVQRLKPAMPVTLKVAGESAPESGSVRLIMPLVDITSRATGVRIRFERERAAPVGAFCEASITVAKVGGWVVPGTALQQDAQGMYVWQVGPKNVAARKPVTVVMRTAGSAVVKESLGGTPIVAKAGSFLKEGDLVAVVKE
ncbi:MAG: efflux RND transporter periplasmic adaptor subunit [Nevskiaceae bacterium]